MLPDNANWVTDNGLKLHPFGLNPLLTNQNQMIKAMLKKMRPDGIGENEKWCGDCQKVKNKSE